VTFGWGRRSVIGRRCELAGSGVFREEHLMHIVTRFDLGDTVWKSWNGTESYWAPCAFCDATGQISSADGNTIRPCPECYGGKGKKEWRPKAWLVLGPYTVGRVTVEITRREVALDFRVDDREERYMCVETGIGSGALHSGNDLFSTEDDARAACDTRNGATAE
jgi:hypothetical protein